MGFWTWVATVTGSVIAGGLATLFLYIMYLIFIINRED